MYHDMLYFSLEISLFLKFFINSPDPSGSSDTVLLDWHNIYILRWSDFSDTFSTIGFTEILIYLKHSDFRFDVYSWNKNNYFDKG